MVGEETGGASLTLLEFYRSRRHEVDVLSDKKLLFLLSFVAELRRVTVDGLVEHLGWPRAEVAELLSMLGNGGFVRNRSRFEMVITDSGARFLNSLGLRPTPKQQSISARLVLSWEASAFPPTFSSVLPRRAGEEQPAYEMRLMEQARGGSEEAFEALMRELWSFVYMRCFFALKNVADAQDAAIAVFLKAFRGLREFEPRRYPPNAVRGWFGTIARNTAFDSLRRMSPPNVQLDPEGALSNPELDQLESGELDPEQLLLLKEHHEAVSKGVFEQPLQRAFHAAWEQLGVTDRMVLGLRFWNELSYHEISEELEMPESQVRNRVFRARARLRHLLDEKRGRSS